MSRILTIAGLSALIAACSAASEVPNRISLSCVRPSSISLTADPTSTKRILALDGCGCIRILDADGNLGQCRHEKAGPGQIAVDAEGTIWIADTFRRRTLALRPSTKALSFAVLGRTSYPVNIATSPQLRGAWLIESNNTFVRYINPTASVNAKFGVGAQPVALIAQGRSAVVLLQNGQIKRVETTGHVKNIYSAKHERLQGVAGSNSNSFWVLAQDNVLLINGDELVSRFACHDCRWAASASSADGSLWASDSIHNSLINMKRDGKIKTLAIGDRLNVPRSLVTTEDGTVWVVLGSDTIEILRGAESRSQS